MRLSEAEVDKTYTIQKITAKAPLNHRLLSMGFTQDASISVLAMTMAKGTYRIAVENTIVALRKEEADLILVEKVQ